MKKISNTPIFVTQSSLPSFKDFTSDLSKVWGSKVLTNFGECHKEFELELSEYLNIDYLSLCSNGTLALLIALRALNISGEVITTPFTFVATSNVLLWLGITPVFADIDEETGNIDPKKIEPLITEKTTAILAVHTYGNPCEIDLIEEIGLKYKIKVIFDGAQAFGVNNGNFSVLNHGDISVVSFHATKVFNTFEGGALILKNEKLKKKVDSLINFGFENEESITEIGINAKLSEFNALLGTNQLKYIDNYILKRKAKSELYFSLLESNKYLSFFRFSEHFSQNFGYLPIMIFGHKSITRDLVYLRLKEQGIYSRKYFYPILTEFKPYKELGYKSSDTPIAKSISDRVLCLPIFPDLSEENIVKICSSINSLLS